MSHAADPASRGGKCYYLLFGKCNMSPRHPPRAAPVDPTPTPSEPQWRQQRQKHRKLQYLAGLGTLERAPEQELGRGGDMGAASRRGIIINSNLNFLLAHCTRHFTQGRSGGRAAVSRPHVWHVTASRFQHNKLFKYLVETSF